jgi:hypothetical protein
VGVVDGVCLYGEVLVENGIERGTKAIYKGN